MNKEKNKRKTENGKVKAWIKQTQRKLLAYCTRAI